MKIDPEVHRLRKSLIAGLEFDRLPWWTHWRDLADFILPKRYTWLLSPTERQNRMSKNPNILDGTGTQAAKTLASGMMNGITSPSRPWFKLNIAGFSEDSDSSARMWLDEVERRMLLVLAESNFYNAMAVVYLDLVVFGTSAMLIYEDVDTVIRCYNSPLGQYYLIIDDRLLVCGYADRFTQKVSQVVKWFGIDNCSMRVQEAWRIGGNRLNEEVTVVHLIEPNDDRAGQLSSQYQSREFYWEEGCENGTVLRVTGFFELPGIFPRWEITGNDPYGTSPGMDALADIIQLQQETKRKGQSIDYMIRPPLLSDISLSGRPTGLLPGSNTFVANLANNGGARPIYQITPAIQELSLDIKEVQTRINSIFFNDLFKMISQLDTVRSAAEIGARQEEKLILLGPVLERLGNEALDKAISRVYNVMARGRMLPPPPQSIQQANVEVRYISILSAAQSAAGVLPTERWLQVIGNVAAVHPQAVDIPNWDILLSSYGRDLGVRARDINSPEEIDAIRQQKNAAAAVSQGADVAQKLAMGAKNLSQTDVGGGVNALQRLAGG